MPVMGIAHNFAGAKVLLFFEMCKEKMKKVHFKSKKNLQAFRNACKPHIP